MDPFTQRMLERARARQEKIDQKLANSGQVVPKRKPLSENVASLKNQPSPVKSPHKASVESPKKLLKDNTKSPRRVSQKADVLSPAKMRNDVVVTKKEFRSPRGSRESSGRRNSDVSVEINIMHRNDIQIEVQVEERDAPMGIVYDTNSDSESGVIIKEIEEEKSRSEKENKQSDMSEKQNERGAPLRRDVKSRLDRLGNLYSDKAELSSPIHRTELEFSAGTPPQRAPQKQDGKKKFGRLAALADQINNWEDDLTHHTFQPEQTKKISKFDKKNDKLESSTLDISIHSINDIDRALKSTVKSNRTTKVNSRTFTKSNESQQRLEKNIVAELEGDGYRRVSAGQSRLVYDFKSTETPDRVRQEPKRTSTTPSAAATPNMATMVASPPNVTKKPSIKKYKAPVPPRKVDAELDNDKDKENNATQKDDENLDCKQTKPADEAPASPVVKRVVPKLNGNIDRSSVLSKAAMFEAGSPRAKEKDPAEMSLRERKALFEKNKGAAIIPKAPFGLAPSVKSLHGDNKAKAAPSIPATPTKPVVNRTDAKDEDSVSQSSLGGGIKDKLAALLNKEQTISETTIQNKFRQEREREMEMLNNRFNVPSKQESKVEDHSDDEHSDNDPSENAPLMGSTTSLAQAFKKPEIIANIPKLTADKEFDKVPKADDKVIGTQPVKRRSSQDSPVVLSVLEDVKRIKVNSNKKEANGTSLAPATLYPHLSDIETDNSHTQDEYSECGGSSSESTTPDNLNKSENWAETSFSRDVMNVVKKNNTSYKKAVRESDSDESGDCDSELDDLLDEALNDSEGPTPPKQNKNGALSSSSFVYQQRSEFKSPQKPAAPVTPSISRDRGNELVHSVSFYRRMQNASSTPTTPMRTVRHSSPDRDTPCTPGDAPPAVTTVRQRIKELQQEIVKQQTIISQASQALNLCAATVEFSGSTEQAEGERLLLLATHRRQACVHEVQRLQVEGAGAAGAAGMAALHVTGLAVPLRRDYVRQLNADGAVGHHCVCLLKCRDRVLATSMQLTRPTATLLQFPDDIRMEGLASDFKVTIEVYLLQASKENLPHEVKYHITNKKTSSKLLLTPKSKKCTSGSASLKTPSVQSPGGPAAVRSPHFALHGYCIFALSHHNRNTFTLSKVPCGSPLEGSVNINISARVRVPPPSPHAAFLTAFDDVSGLGAWHRRWFRLQPPTLAYWKYPDDVTKKMPIGDIDLNTVISEKVVKAPRDLCARPNTLLLESSVPAGLIIPDSGSLVYVKRPDGTVVRRHLLAADTPKDRDIWLECLNQALEYVRCSLKDDD